MLSSLQECNCNPAGAKSIPGYPHGGCGSHAIAGRLCECKERVEGHICDKCKPGYWNLDTNNQRGCEDCSCYKPGTTGASRVCNTLGQCMCKPFVDGRRCDMCRDGTFNLQDYNIFGCEGKKIRSIYVYLESIWTKIIKYINLCCLAHVDDY